MLDLLYKRRSIRKYKNIKVEEEKIEKLMEAALLSPSGRNKKPWNFIFVENKDYIEKLVASKETGAHFVKDAALVLVVLGDSELSDTWVEDTSIAITFIQLQAESLGLGSCWVQIRDRKTKDGISSEEFIKSLLKVETTNRVEALISIGYPDETKASYKKEDLDFSKIKRV